MAIAPESTTVTYSTMGSWNAESPGREDAEEDAKDVTGSVTGPTGRVCAFLRQTLRL